MRPELVWALFKKEVLSTLRDRRAVTGAVLMPLILMPLFVVGFPLAFGNLLGREAEAVSQVALQGERELPEALRVMLEARSVALSVVQDAYASVEDGSYPAALELPLGFLAALEAGQNSRAVIISKSGNLRSELVASKLQGALRDYQQDLVLARLQAAGLDEAVLTPVALESVDASSESEQGAGLLGWLIPYFIAIFTLTGGQMTAIDATAGEKERGTLESLLVAPVRRAEVVVGKALATLVFGLGAALVGIGSYMLSGLLLGALAQSEMGAQLTGTLAFALPTLGLLLVSALLMSALIASLLIGIAMYAKSFKQAQSFIAPLTFVMILPALALQFVDFITVSSALYLVPVLNVLLLMNDAVRGQAEPLPVLLTWGSSLLYAALCLAFAYRNFRREDVIFRS